MSQESKDLAKKFIKFLNEKYPLKNDILVSFLGERTGQMTTALVEVLNLVLKS